MKTSERVLAPAHWVEAGALIEAARRRQRRRRWAIAVAVAAVLAVVLVVMASTGGGAGGHPVQGAQQPPAAAAVPKLATTNLIIYTTTITSFGPPNNTRHVTDVWEYGTQGRQLDESASGQPMWESWVQTGHGKPTLIWVDYQQRSWERFAIAPAVGGRTVRLSLCRAPGALLIAPGATPADWKSVIESGLRCGLFHVAGHQRVGGIDAIKLTGGADSGIIAWASPVGGITVWLDPHTYLPVQLAVAEASSGPKPASVLIHFRWLPPTQANLAQLTGTIPPGFHRTYPR
jgi:hypothetical protein